MWINERGIVNLLSMPMLEEVGYKVSTHTDDDWNVITPRERSLLLKVTPEYATACLILICASIPKALSGD